jgi:hypothetical protein
MDDLIYVDLAFKTDLNVLYNAVLDRRGNLASVMGTDFLIKPGSEPLWTRKSKSAFTKMDSVNVTVGTECGRTFSYSLYEGFVIA